MKLYHYFMFFFTEYFGPGFSEKMIGPARPEIDGFWQVFRTDL